MPRRSISANGHHGIPEATIARLPVYLRALYALADRDIATVSSEELAAAAGVNSAKLRKDLSHLGSYGTRGVGYDVDYLVYQVSRELGLTQDWPVVIVGAGNLGRALANYGGFASRGFRIAALLRHRPGLVGSDDRPGTWSRPSTSLRMSWPAMASRSASSRPRPAPRRESATGSSPPGVTSILNFAPVVLSVPEGSMCVRSTCRLSCRSSRSMRSGAPCPLADQRACCQRTGRPR